MSEALPSFITVKNRIDSLENGKAVGDILQWDGIKWRSGPFGQQSNMKILTVNPSLPQTVNDNYQTISAAIQSIPIAETNTTNIYITSGVYNETFTVDRPVYFKGLGDVTITLTSPVVISKKCTMKNLTFNSSAEAFRLDSSHNMTADLVEFVLCNITTTSTTLYAFDTNAQTKAVPIKFTNCVLTGTYTIKLDNLSTMIIDNCTGCTGIITISSNTAKAAVIKHTEWTGSINLINGASQLTALTNILNIYYSTILTSGNASSITNTKLFSEVICNYVHFYNDLGTASTIDVGLPPVAGVPQVSHIDLKYANLSFSAYTSGGTANDKINAHATSAAVTPIDVIPTVA